MGQSADLARGSDYVIDQRWAEYGSADHAIWRTLFERQSGLLEGRACTEYLEGLHTLHLDADAIPDFDALNPVLRAMTGWQIVAVAGLVPDDVFFSHLAGRRFPVTRWIRRPEQLDYLQEPDIFHDLFGHAPMLINPVFGDFMAAYGRAGLKALRLGALRFLARLYWYTVEFGLIRERDGLRIYGSGIVSSFRESRYSLESDRPRRLPFDLRRIMRTRYRIDDLQETYFVIDGFEELFETLATDFAPIYRWLADQPEFTPADATRE